MLRVGPARDPSLRSGWHHRWLTATLLRCKDSASRAKKQVSTSEGNWKVYFFDCWARQNFRGDGSFSYVYVENLGIKMIYILSYNSIFFRTYSSKIFHSLRLLNLILFNKYYLVNGTEHAFILNITVSLKFAIWTTLHDDNHYKKLFI